MERLETSYLVPDVTAAQCFAYLGDPANGTEWNSFAKQVIAHGDEGVGRVVETRVGFLGITFGVKATCTEWVKDTRYAVTSEFPFHAVMGATFAEEPGGTRVHSTFEIDPGKFFPVPGFVLRRALRTQFDKDVRRLRSCLERLAQD